MVRFEAIVHGIVQGVFFRYNARLRAEELSILGTAENLPDGTVRVIAEGPRDRLESFVAWLRVGPEASVVDRVDVTWSEGTGAYRAFRILR